MGTFKRVLPIYGYFWCARSRSFAKSALCPSTIPLTFECLGHARFRTRKGHVRGSARSHACKRFLVFEFFKSLNAKVWTFPCEAIASGDAYSSFVLSSLPRASIIQKCTLWRCHLFYSTTFERFAEISLSFNCASLPNFEQTRALIGAISDEIIHNSIVYDMAFTIWHGTFHALLCKFTRVWEVEDRVLSIRVRVTGQGLG